ncbi:MAG TPA: hypothetical protein DEU95_06285 [Chloroflexi bacterium]|mgnify:CR=1 FL=1|jgi:hypothetical protein|nr:hypothetical protein [Chloroflexota bacterium]HCG29344.1 hypothetical protein [Chloroflexota bacterium]
MATGVGGTMSLTWYGNQLLAQIHEQTARAMDAVLSDATASAQRSAPIDTGALKNSITFKPAVKTGGALVGSFGSYDIGYAIYQEMGTYRMAARPYLRPAADAFFPTLLDRIGKL